MKNLSTLARSLLATLVLAAPLLVATPAHSISTYTVTHLGGLLASRLNENGDVTGWGVVNGFTKAFVYTAEDGFVYLDLPPGQTYSLAEDVSDRDANGRIHIVGSAYPAILDEPGRAYRWTFQPGVGLVEITALGAVGADPYSVARGINGLGEVVGESDPRSLFLGGMNAFLYDDANGMRSIGKGKPQEINDSSQIVGYSGAFPNVWRYTNGAFENLDKPAETRLAFAYAINESGAVAGSGLLPVSTQERIIRYTDGTGWEVLGGTGITNIGWGINNSGTVVGEGIPETDVQGLGGVIYANDVNRLAYITDFLEAEAAGWSIFAAYDINNAGQIAAYGVRTVNGVEQGGGLLLQPTQTQQAPAAPSNLAGSAQANGISLSWTDNSDNELVFRIERRPAGGTFSSLTTSSFPTYHDASIANCSTYDYRVRAFNDAGNSDYSNTVTVEGPCVVAPTAPTGLSAQQTYYEIALDWNQVGLADVDNFEIERDARDGQGFVTIETATTGTGFLDGGAQLCAIYDYRVRAVNIGGASDYSDTVEVATACPASSDTQAPTVSILTPAVDAEVSDSEVVIEASASDNTAITAMAVEIDGERICTVKQSAAINCSWATRTYPAGSYTVRVIAFDAEGNVGMAEAGVTLLDTLSGGKGDRSLVSQTTDGSGSSSGGGALSWWLMLAGLLPLLRRRFARD